MSEGRGVLISELIGSDGPEIPPEMATAEIPVPADWEPGGRDYTEYPWITHDDAVMAAWFALEVSSRLRGTQPPVVIGTRAHADDAFNEFRSRFLAEPIAGPLGPAPDYLVADDLEEAFEPGDRRRHDGGE